MLAGRGSTVHWTSILLSFYVLFSLIASSSKLTARKQRRTATGGRGGGPLRARGTWVRERGRKLYWSLASKFNTFLLLNFLLELK